jgi:hypothetical protein
MKEGGTARRKHMEQMLKSLGGRLEAFYFAFGENDAYVITEGPDHRSSANEDNRLAHGGGDGSSDTNPSEISPAGRIGVTRRAQAGIQPVTSPRIQKKAASATRPINQE